MFNNEDWKALVAAVQDATESGRLVWEVTGGPLELEQKRTALTFEAVFDTTARVEFFGRFRGYSYRIDLYREGADGYLFEDSRTVTSKAASEDIPFDVLFRTIRAQVSEAWQRRKLANTDRWITWVADCLDGLPLHEHGAWDWGDDSIDVWIDELNQDQWGTVIAKVITATEARNLNWVRDESVAYTKYRGEADENLGFYIDIGQDNEPHGFGMDVPETSGLAYSIGYYSESGGQLEELAELIGASNRRQFEELVKEDALQGFLKGLAGPESV